ncbi:MAG: ABC transporter permease [Candidatus Acidiferrales bacterium]
MLNDIRHGIRMLAKKPGFTLVIVLTLALGIGANTAIFSVVNAVLLRPLPYDHPNRIVAAFETNRGGGRMGLSRLDFEDWRAQSQTFDLLAAYDWGNQNFLGGSRPERIIGADVSQDFFAVFGVRPILGRTFGSQEFRSAQLQVGVIGEDLWRSQFGGQASVLGRAVQVDGAPIAIVGVMPAEFDYPSGTQIWTPLDLSQDHTDHSAHNYHVIGRLKPGVPLAEAAAEMEAIAGRLELEYPSSNANVGAKLIRLQDSMTSNVRASLLLLLAMVGLLLLVACANVANLLLVRASARRREIAVRAALGASRSRLVGQLLIESALLALLGGAAGIVLSIWTNGALMALLPAHVLPVKVAPLDLSVLAFAFVLSFVTVLLFGLAPAVQASRIDLVEGLRKAKAEGVSRNRFRAVLVGGEIALSVLLLVGAGLMARSLLALEGESLGFDPSHLAVLGVSFPSSPGSEANWVQSYTELLDRLRQVPGIQAAALTDAMPLTSSGSNGGFIIEGRPARNLGSQANQAEWNLVGEDYFSAMKIPLMRGRAFQTLDRTGPKVAIVSRALVEKIWPGMNPLGQRVALPGLDDETFAAYKRGSNVWFQVVGIVGDVRSEEVGLPARPAIYVPYFQAPRLGSEMSVVLRTSLPFSTLREATIREVRGVRSDSPVQLASFGAVFLKSIVIPRFRFYLIGAFAFLALALAGVGIYGVVAYVTAQRTQEIGIRMALGAQQGNVRLLILRQGIALALVGLAAGLIAAFGLVHFMARFLYGIQPLDALTFAVVALVITFVAALACYIPARRASRVDPIVALRYE